MTRRRSWLAGLAAVIVLAGAVVVWERTRPEPIRILAVPELGDLRPVLAEFTRETGIPVELVLEEHVRIARRVAEGRPDFDAVWSHTDPESGGHLLGSGTTVMSSPVLLGLREPLAESMRWREGVNWTAVVDAAGRGEFTFGMSAPESSFSGRAVVLAAATGLVGAVDGLSARDVYPVAAPLHVLSKAEAFTAPTDAGLVAWFLKDRGKTVDGLFTYESEIARLNDSGRLEQRLVAVRVEGAVTARYALRALLKPRTAEAGEGVSRLTGRRLDRDVQQRISELTHRRPGAPGVTPPETLAGPSPRPLDVPADQYVVHRLVDAYLGRYRYDVRMLFILNVSCSMRTHMKELREAVTALAGSLTIGTPRGGDGHLIFLPFGSRPAEPRTVRLSAGDPAAGLRDVDALLDGLAPRGNAALHDALVAGYRELERFPEDDRIVSIILVTDDAGWRERDLARFLSRHATFAPWLRAVPVYPVTVGETGTLPLKRLAIETGGRMLSARHQDDLATDFLIARSWRR